MDPTQIIIERVRTFSAHRKVTIRPLTLLVGENSSGKSTFLATVAAILNGSRFPVSPSFNEPPYSLGVFDTIATFKGGKYGRASEFTLGFRHGLASPHEVSASYVSDHGNVTLRRLNAVNAEARLEISL